MATTARRRVTPRLPAYQGYGDLPMTVTDEDDKKKVGGGTLNTTGRKSAGNGHHSNNNGKNLHKKIQIKDNDEKKKSAVESDENRGCSYYFSRMRVILTLMGINLFVIWVYRSYQNGQDELKYIVSIVKQKMIEKNARNNRNFSPVLDDSYVVFVTASNGKSSPRGTYIRMGRSKSSVLEAVKDATQQLPISVLLQRPKKKRETQQQQQLQPLKNLSSEDKQKRDRKVNLGGGGFVWFQIDVVTGIKRLESFDTNQPLAKEVGDNWFGFALGWDDFVVLPSQVQAYSLIDSEGYLRWERILQYLQKNHQYSPLRNLHHSFNGGGEGNGGRGWQQWKSKVKAVMPDYSDDATTVDSIDLFKTESIFIDMSTYNVHHTYHSTILPDPYHLGQGGLRHYDYPTKKLMLDAVDKAALYASQVVDPNEGFMVSHYQPRSHYLEFTSESSEMWEDHATSLLELARLHSYYSSKFRNQNDSQNIDNNFDLERANNIELSLKHGLSYVTKQLRACYVPFPPLFQKKHAEEDYQCLINRPTKGRTAKLSDNAMLLAALLEYMDTMNGDKAYFYWIMELAHYIQGSFVENKGDPQYQYLMHNSFVQKVQQPPYVKRGIPVTNAIDDSSEAQAAFALSRLVQVFNKYSITSKENDIAENIEKWNEIAHRSVQQLIMRREKEGEKDPKKHLPDPWLLQAITQLSLISEQQQKGGRSGKYQLTSEMANYVVRCVHIMSHLQIKEKDDINRGGFKTMLSSVAATTRFSGGMCSLHRLLSLGSIDVKEVPLSSFLEVMILAVFYLLPHQIQPETSMFLPHDTRRAIGGWRYATTTSQKGEGEDTNDYSILDISTLNTVTAANVISCTQQILEEESKVMVEKIIRKLFGEEAEL